MSLLSAISRSSPPVPTPQEGFSKFVRKDGPLYDDLGPCHIWLGGKVRGVPYFRDMPAMRFAFLAQGGDPGTSRVYKRCSVSLCVNPDHAFLGKTQEELVTQAEKTKGERAFERLTRERISLAKTREEREGKEALARIKAER